MISKMACSLAAAALLTAAICRSGFALTPDVIASRQLPDDAQQAQLAPSTRECIVHNEDFTASKTFVIELTNTCEQRIRCTLHAYVVNAMGPTKGEATLTLEPVSKGTEARKLYILKLKENYGEANTSQSCEML